ncbi:GT-D fold domain-containing glycosyltransferase [Companilactobacillus nuruki]|uniref:GT-D fold domain-containing glycosyltransferase n=1 Tax=Companilactobacillus nuruki TaxID=1993540 RepID=UPI001416F84C|nr:GT-D fold domain-containing glycosyltransferase [Companilactobacillus nuruki]
MDFDTTIKKIIDEDLSVTRFGDGEFRFLLSMDLGNTFEINSVRLSNQLNRVLEYNDKKLLICVPSVYLNLSNMKLSNKVFWEREVSIYLKKYYKYLNSNYLYGDAFFTRPYQGYLFSHREVERRFNCIKKMWENRDVIMVEGEFTRFGVGNNLFKYAKSVRRIIAPSTNAFEKIDDIYNVIKDEVLSNPHHRPLLLISLGPTATVLTPRISVELHVQAIDIGHLDIEYEWFLRRADSKIPIEGKYVNESTREKYIQGEINKEYLGEIDAVVK